MPSGRAKANLFDSCYNKAADSEDADKAFGASLIIGLQCEMEWNGMEWNEMEWNGMEWNGMEWNGMEWCSYLTGETV